MIASVPRRGAVAALFGLVALAAVPAAAAPAGPLLVFAAASLKNALDAVDAKFHADSGEPAALISYAASSALAKQIAAGAPADLFISADLKWMDWLAERRLIRPQSRVDLLGNRLVLIAPVNSPLGTSVPVRLVTGFPLAQLLRGGRLAMADPSAVPAGIYGREALTSLGMWSSIAGRIAAAENVRAALALVARGEAPLGIVYQTDAAIDPAVKIVATFAASATRPIVYPMALTRTARPGAALFASFLQGPAARRIFTAAGFRVLDRTP